MAFRLAGLPDFAPRYGNAFTRWLGRTILRLGGWTMAGDFPNERKLMVLAAPHSSAWDAFWGLAAKLAMGADVRFMAKKELFRGPLGWLLIKFGIFPVDRSAPGGIVGEVAGKYAASDVLWLGVAPEGTRKRVEKWKTGFWRIARAANVPVLCAYFHYPEKTVGIGAVIHLTDDMDADMARIRDYYRPWIGKHRGTV